MTHPNGAPPAGVWSAAWLVTAVLVLSNAPTPLYVHWQEVLGFSSGTLTVIFAVYMVGLLLALLVAGQISDRFGRKAVLTPSLLLGLIACGLFAVSASTGMLIAARFLAGAAIGMTLSSGMAAVVDAAGVAHRRTAARLASIAMVLGAGLGPLLAGACAQVLADPVVAIFATEAVILLTAALVVWRLPSRGPARAPLNLRLPRVPAENRLELLYGIATFGPGITATSFVLSLGPSVLARLLDVDSPLLAGGVACAMFFVAVSVQFVVGRWPVPRVFAASGLATVLSMLCLILAIQTSSVPAIVGAALLAGAGQGMGQMAGFTLIGLYVPDTHRAQGNALLNIGGYVPAGLLPVATGYLIDAVGLAAGATAFAVVLGVAALSGGLWAMGGARRTTR